MVGYYSCPQCACCIPTLTSKRKTGQVELHTLLAALYSFCDMFIYYLFPMGVFFCFSNCSGEAQLVVTFVVCCRNVYDRETKVELSLAGKMLICQSCNIILIEVRAMSFFPHRRLNLHYFKVSYTVMWGKADGGCVRYAVSRC